MKKLIALMTLVSMITFVGFAGNPKKKTAHKNAKTSTAVVVKVGEEHSYGEGLSTREYSVKTKNADIKVEYPVAGSPALVDAIRNYIKDKINQKYTGSLSSPEDLIKSAVKALDSGESINEEINVVFNGVHSISLKDTGYLNMKGAAHGMPWSTGKTFLKSNGNTFEISMFPPIEKFMSPIATGLAQYLNVPISALKDEIFGWGTSEFAYPSTVFLTNEGIELIWEPYEIGPYSMGMPTVTIPATSENLKLLAPEAQSFF